MKVYDLTHAIKGTGDLRQSDGSGVREIEGRPDLNGKFYPDCGASVGDWAADPETAVRILQTRSRVARETWEVQVLKLQDMLRRLDAIDAGLAEGRLPMAKAEGASHA